MAGSANPHDSISSERFLSKAEYQDRVRASWLGQIIGNIYGLSYEFRFLDEPGPDNFPYGYGRALNRVREVDGAFSDDDTDIEYLILMQMEKYGPEPTYEQLSNAWKYHIRDRIWAANRVALTLMHHGYWPPATGDSENNPRWFEIDPQLVNEIWAVTAPGMVDYAVGKTEWSARITSDDFGLEPAMFYAAMYAEAFFTSDIEVLLDTGAAALPEGSRFGAMVTEMRGLHARFPDDWPAARKQLRDRYYGQQPYNRHGWAPIDAMLNGSAAVLALLYGQGDLWRTLDLACAMGFDADNQAATLTGLLALAQGSQALPEELLFPLQDEVWTKPFNDRYVNITRYDVPDASIENMAYRLAAQGEAVVLSQGGRIEMRNGAEYIVIPSAAKFTPPFEVLPPAPILTDVETPIDVSLYASGGGRPIDWTVAGALPPGIEFMEGRFTGSIRDPGEYVAEVIASNGVRQQRVQVHFTSRKPNLAPTAARILHNTIVPELERLRDGIRKDPAFYSETYDHPVRQWYGYAWSQPVTVSRLGLYIGFPREEWGWLKDPIVEYMDATGAWIPVQHQSIQPPFPAGTSKYLQPGLVAYDIHFATVSTTAIRLTGMAGGDPVDGQPTFGSTVSELTVHAE